MYFNYCFLSIGIPFYLKLLFVFKVAICDLEDNFFIIYEITFFTPNIISMVDTYLETPRAPNNTNKTYIVRLIVI